MSPTTKKLAVQALIALRGDDLERAKAAFSPAKMNLDREWGASGKTPRQLLAEYQAHADAVDAAIEEIRAL